MSNQNNKDIFNQTYDVGFIVAMVEELQALLIQDPEITDMVAFEKIVAGATRLGNARFIPFKLQAYNDQNQLITLNCIACLTGIGKVNAAMGTTALLTRFDVDTLINIGFCGSNHAEDSIGTVFFIDYAIAGDTNVTAFGYDFGQVPNEEYAFYATPHKFVNALYMASKDRYKVVRGVCITTDQFMENRGYREAITLRIEETFRKYKMTPYIGCFDMELAAMAQVANSFGRKIISLKEASDGADEDATAEFNASAKNQANMLQFTIDILTDSIPFIHHAIQVKRYRKSLGK